MFLVPWLVYTLLVTITGIGAAAVFSPIIVGPGATIWFSSLLVYGKLFRNSLLLLILITLCLVVHLSRLRLRVISIPDFIYSLSPCFTALAIYFWIVVFSYLHELKGNTKREVTFIPATIAAPVPVIPNPADVPVKIPINDTHLPMCIICDNHRINTICVPCGHTLCHVCAAHVDRWVQDSTDHSQRQFKNCFFCREHVVQTVLMRF